MAGKVWRGTKRVVKAGLGASCAVGSLLAFESAKGGSVFVGLVGVGLAFSSGTLLKSALFADKKKEESNEMDS